MKPKPVRSMHCATASGPRSSLTPSASSTSALPQRLDAARLPCLATGWPSEATSSPAAVETLKVSAPSPPVPQVSTTCVRDASGTCTPALRMPRAMPVTSSTVSPFRRSASRKAPICAWVATPVMISSITAVASVSLSELPATRLPIASRIICALPMGWRCETATSGDFRRHIPRRSGTTSASERAGSMRAERLRSLRGLRHAGAFRQKVAQDVFARACHDGFRMKLHAVDGILTMAQPHDETVCRLGGDFQRGGQRRALDDQAVVADRLERLRQPAQHTRARMLDQRSLAMNWLWRADHPPAKHLADTLMPQTDAQQRDTWPQRGDERIRDARLSWCAGARRDDNVRWRQRLHLRHAHLVVAPHIHLGAQLSEILVEVVGEAIVVIEQQNHRAPPLARRATGARCCAMSR